MLPSGEQLFLNKKNYNYTKYIVEVISDNGDKELINTDKLLETVPTHYRGRIIKNRFGFPNIKKEERYNIRKGHSWFKKKLQPLTTFDEVDKIIIKKLFLSQNLNNPISDTTDIQTYFILSLK
ncbi:hypothetical protein [Fodinibius saliphilus]|uniref:hypothetical protein n=1 Tax=Fodinibius saliphilus TaxID=1920650 RepID=UPI001109175A|nr:hypothetical protein [Fodinibius saliphilus]